MLFEHYVWPSSVVSLLEYPAVFLPSSITVYPELAVKPVVVNKISPFAPAPALFVSGACRPVVKSKVPEPLNVTIVVFDDPLHNNVTLGSCNDEVPFDTFQNNFVIDNLCEVASPLDATSEKLL